MKSPVSAGRRGAPAARVVPDRGRRVEDLNVLEVAGVACDIESHPVAIDQRRRSLDRRSGHPPFLGNRTKPSLAQFVGPSVGIESDRACVALVVDLVGEIVLDERRTERSDTEEQVVARVSLDEGWRRQVEQPRRPPVVVAQLQQVTGTDELLQDLRDVRRG